MKSLQDKTTPQLIEELKQRHSDIERKLAEEMPHKSEELYRILLEKESDAIIVLDVEMHRLEDINPAALGHGYTDMNRWMVESSSRDSA